MKIKKENLKKETEKWFKKIRKAQENDNLTEDKKQKIAEKLNSDMDFWNNLLKEEYDKIKRKKEHSEKDLKKALKKGEKKIKETIKQRLKHFIED